MRSDKIVRTKALPVISILLFVITVAALFAALSAPAHALTASTCSYRKTITYYSVPSTVETTVCVQNKNTFPVNISLSASPNLASIISFPQQKVELAAGEKRYIAVKATVTTEFEYEGAITYTFTTSPANDNFPFGEISSQVTIRKGTNECVIGNQNVCSVNGCHGLQDCLNGTWGPCVKNDPLCGIECIEDTDCELTDCSANSGCSDGRYHLCSSLSNTCKSDQTCTHIQCSSTEFCPIAGADKDGDGYDTQCGDCNDNNRLAYPGAPEIADNGVDEDCDGEDLRSCRIMSPEHKVYNKSLILFNVTCPVVQKEIKYSLGQSYITLCRNCISFNAPKSFWEGVNRLSVVTLDNEGLSYNLSQTFVVDTKVPKISKTMPLTKGYGSGIFNVTYTELNPSKVWLNYRRNGSNTPFISVLRTDCPSGTASCDISANLSQFDGSSVEYFFKITDIANNSVQSASSIIKVDRQKPVMTLLSPILAVYAKTTVLVNISSNEPVEMGYIDVADKKPTYKKLCSNCKSYSKTVNFKEGIHNVTFMAKDPAGNDVSIIKNFIVDSQKPSLSRTTPQSGYTSGVFSVAYKERYCTNIKLTVISGSTIKEKSYPCVDISKCAANNTCSTPQVLKNLTYDMSQFNNNTISYIINITDIAGNSVGKKVNNIKVDTIKPVFTTFSAKQEGRYLTLNTTFSEKVAKFMYINNAAPTPRETVICSGCIESGNKTMKKLSLSRGNYSMTYIIDDYAGNRAVINGPAFVVN